MNRLAATLLAVVAAAAFAQQKPASSGNPEEDWGNFPPDKAQAKPLPPPPPPADANLQNDQRLVPVPPPPPTQPAAQPELRRTIRPPKPEDFNNISMFGAPSPGKWNRGIGVYLGFPLLGIKAGVGITDQLDLGPEFESFYGVMNDFRLYARYQLFGVTAADYRRDLGSDPGAALSGWTGSFVLDGGEAFFTQRPSGEGKGARWLTGRRNYNVTGGFIFSYRGETPRAARLFLDVRYHLAIDTEPYQKDPLGGVPANIQYGSNFPVRLGAEMPFSPKTSFLFLLGFDIHLRPDDSSFMPYCSVGLVTSI